jgi:hypothetical protein
MRLTQLAFLGLALVACRGGGGDDGDDTPDPDGPPVGGVVTIQEVQSDTMPSGTSIELEGVVVVAIDELGRGAGDFFVSEPEGGAFSGVKVFGAPLEMVAALTPGDVVNITGAIKHEACTEAAPCGTVVFDNGAGITEVIGQEQGSLIVTKVGTGPLPTPTTVDAKAIAALPSREERDAEWEKYEGVFVKVVNARQLSDIGTFGSNPQPDATEFRVTGFARVQSALVALPQTSVAGTCYESITGVVDFFFNYIIAPRSADDFVDGGTGCNPMATTISGVQTAPAVPELALLTDVFVTGIGFDNKRNIWVSSSLTAAPNEGVMIFTNQQAHPAGLAVGKKITVVGGVDEFNDDANGGALTEIVNPTITVSGDAAGVIVPMARTVAQLMDPTDGPTFESVSVTLTNVNLMALGDATNGFIGTAVQNGTTFKFTTEILRPAAADLGCYATITGLWTQLQAPATGATTKPNAMGFVPAVLGTKNGVCN